MKQQQLCSIRDILSKALLMGIFLAQLIGYNCLADDLNPDSMGFILQVGETLGKTRLDRLNSLRAAERDLIVIDYSEHGDHHTKWTRDEIALLKAEGATKVLCYLSIGEAEDYRSYWKKRWKKEFRPDFLCAENTNWEGNFKVKYWDKKWQTIILSYLDEILDQDFDGVYLDSIDTFQFFENDPAANKLIKNRINPATHNSFRQDMINFVSAIARHAHFQKKDFTIIPQNGSELLTSAVYISTIDAIGIEDLFTVGNKLQNSVHTELVLKNLQKLLIKPILVIEYPTTAKLKHYVKKEAHRHGFKLLITDRLLKTIGESGN